MFLLELCYVTWNNVMIIIPYISKNRLKIGLSQEHIENLSSPRKCLNIELIE